MSQRTTQILTQESSLVIHVATGANLSLDARLVEDLIAMTCVRSLTAAKVFVVVAARVVTDQATALPVAAITTTTTTRVHLVGLLWVARLGVHGALVGTAAVVDVGRGTLIAITS